MKRGPKDTLELERMRLREYRLKGGRVEGDVMNVMQVSANKVYEIRVCVVRRKAKEKDF